MSMSLPNRIYAELKSEILAHRLAPSSTLRIEAISERFRTSTIPVREALARLCNEGLAIHENRLGFSVRPVTPKTLEDDYRTLAAILQLGAAEVVVSLKVADRSSTVDGSPTMDELAKSDSVEMLDELLLEALPSKQLAGLGTFCLMHSRYFQRIDLELRGEAGRRHFISRRRRAAAALAAGRANVAQKLIAEERDSRIENIPSVMREMLFRQLSG